MADDEQGVDNPVEFMWLEKEVVPQIAEAMGKNAEEFRCKIKVPDDGFFISSIYMVDLIPRYGCETEKEKYSFVIKLQPVDESRCSLLRTDILFHNEIVFYKRLGRNYINYPKCMFTVSEPISEAMIVLENVTQFGYRSMPSTELRGMKHALAAVQEIGRFHAQGYVLKEKNPDEFFGVVEELLRIYDDTVDPMYVEYFNTLALRPVNYLRSVNHDPEFCDKISICLGDTYERIMKDCMKPKNELAVICHGDFTANNVLWKQEDDGKFKSILIDFAQVRYASPATDLSTFLFVSCKEEVWKNFSVIYRAYHDAVLEHLEEQGVQDLQRYSFDAFLEDYTRHAISGCVIAICSASIFCLGSAFADFSDVMNNKSKYFEIMKTAGGDEVSKRLADMLVEFKDNGWLAHLM